MQKTRLTVYPAHDVSQVMEVVRSLEGIELLEVGADSIDYAVQTSKQSCLRSQVRNIPGVLFTATHGEYEVQAS